jgi:glycosyltransferase involved in cell wall biosynthesis
LSDYYSLPNKLFEYAFAGLPILASDFPEIRKIVDKYSLGYYTDNNIEKIEETIISLQNLTIKKANEFNFKNLDELSWIAQENRLQNLYDNLLNKNN